MDLFCIITKNAEEAFDVMLKMSDYHIVFTILTNYDDNPNSFVMVCHEYTSGRDTYEPFRLAEINCQMNYRQIDSMTCPACEKKGLDVCGHLTFVND